MIFLLDRSLIRTIVLTRSYTEAGGWAAPDGTCGIEASVMPNLDLLVSTLLGMPTPIDLVFGIPTAGRLP